MVKQERVGPTTERQRHVILDALRGLALMGIALARLLLTLFVDIHEDNFASWLRDAQSYSEMFAFLLQGACERMWEFVEGHRLPKVVGLFILGYLIGKHHLYAQLQELPLGRLF